MLKFKRWVCLHGACECLARTKRASLFLIVGAIGLVPRGNTTQAAEALARSGVLSPDVLVAEVLQRSPDLAAAEAAWDAARARVAPAGDLPDPMFSYGAAPQTAGDAGGLEQIAGLSQAIPWPGTLGLRRDAARALAQSSKDRFRDVRLRLAELTRAQYAQWFYVYRALRINAENQTLLDRLRGAAEAAYASGQGPEQDVLRTDVERTLLKNQALVLQRRRIAIRARINALLDRDPNAPLAPPADLPASPPLRPQGELQRAALARYPELSALDAAIKAKRDRIGLARKGRYPNFTLGTGYTQLMPTDKRWTVGITINIPLDQSRRRAEIDEAQAEVRETQARKSDLRERVLSDLSRAYATAWQARSSVVLDRRRLVPFARENFDASQADYRTGNGDFLKLITAERAYLTAELDLARARADLYVQLASLDYLTAGAVLSTPGSTDIGMVTP